MGTPKKYYALYITEHYVTSRTEIQIKEYPNDNGTSREDINKTPSTFTDRADAATAKTRIWMAMNKIQQKKY